MVIEARRLGRDRLRDTPSSTYSPAGRFWKRQHSSDHKRTSVRSQACPATECTYISVRLCFRLEFYPKIAIIQLLMFRFSAESWSCYSDEYCGFNSYYSAFGCCTGVAGQSLEGCNIITTCLDSTAFVASCGSACQTNALVGWW